MPVTANIIFAQAPGGTRAAGADVDDGVVGNVVNITNANNAGIASWAVRLADVPVGPEADSTSGLTVGALAAGSLPLVSAAFTPDAFGAFAVELEVIGTDGTVARARGTFGCPNERGWFRPAFKQDVASSSFGTNLRGWAQQTDDIQADARLAAVKTNALQQHVPMLVGMRETAQTGFETVGACRFDPSALPATGTADLVRTITFRALIYASVGMTPQIRVFNYTDGVQVATTVLTSSVTPNVPTWVSATLAVPADLPNAVKTYEAQLRISSVGPSPTDRAYAMHAGFDVTLG